MKRLTRALAALTALLGLVACQSAGKSNLEQELDSFDAMAMKHQQLIAACMKGRGWTYLPHLSKGTVLERQQMLAQEQGRTFNPETATAPPDPNDAIVVKLSDAEKESYADAYWGDLEEGGSDKGCYEQTYEQAWGGRMPEPDDAEIAAMEAAIQADARTIAAARKYAGCMQTAGYAVRTVTDIFRTYDLKLEELNAKISGEGGNPDESPAVRALVAEQSAAYIEHEKCVKDYNAVENTVQQEYLKKHPITEKKDR